MLLADLLRRAQALVRVRRRHADVDERDVRRVGAHLQHQLVGVAGLADDLEAAVLEQPRDALAQQDGVLGEDDAQARFSGSSPTTSPGSRSSAERREVKLEPGATSCRIRSGSGEAAQLVRRRGRAPPARRRAQPACRPRRGSGRRDRRRRSGPPGARRRRSTSSPASAGLPVWMPMRGLDDGAAPAASAPRRPRATALLGAVEGGEELVARGSRPRGRRPPRPRRGPRPRYSSSTWMYPSPSRWTRPVESSMSDEEERDDAAGKRCPGQPAAQSKS